MADKPIIDLHLHTTRSDGRFDAAALLAKLVAAGVDYAAVTDHDTLFGARDLLKVAQGTNLRVIPGMEISTAFLDAGGNLIEEIHVLWYGMDIEARKVLDFEDEIRVAQNGRLARMVAGLEKQGIKISAAEAIESSSPAPACYVPLIFQLIASGYLKLEHGAIRSFIDEQFAPGGKVYVPPSVKTDEAVSRAKSIGGLVIAAHPAKIASSDARDGLIEMSDGIEAYYSAHSAEDRTRFSQICANAGKLATCGSDFHGYYETEYTPPALDDEELERVMEFISKAAIRK